MQTMSMMFGTLVTKFAVAHKELTFLIGAITCMKYHCLSFVNCNLLVRLVTDLGKNVDEIL